MNKKTIITALLALIVLAGCKQETKEQEHVFTPVVHDTIDFVIEGTGAKERKQSLTGFGCEIMLELRTRSNGHNLLF